MAKSRKRTTPAGSDIELIRAAVRSRHGGFDGASDREILSLWNTFAPARRKRYLEGEIAGGRPPEEEVEAGSRAAAPGNREEARADDADDRPACWTGRKDGVKDADTAEPK